MTESECEVIPLVHSSTTPTVALEIALKLVLEFLEPHEASPCKTPALLSEVS